MQLVDLTDLEFVRVSGADTIQFLQGQVTCDMEQLSQGQTLRGALCNIKGRVIADFRALLRGEDCLLQTGAGMAEIIVSTLARYAVFSKVELAIDNSVAAVFGALDAGERLRAKFGALPEADDQALEAEDTSIIRVPGTTARYQLWCHSAAGEHGLRADPDIAVSNRHELWQHADIEAGIIHVNKQLSEQYTPQLLNYDISGVIDFNKGCYTGQEVVARMYYRGKPKKRLFLIAADSDIGPDSAVIEGSDGSEKSAEIISFSNLQPDGQTQHLALAILSADVAEKQTPLSLSNQPNTFLQILTIPYTE